MHTMNYHNNSNHTKLTQWCTPGTWVGFTDGNPVGTYHVLNPKTQKITLKKGMTFLGKLYDQWNEVKKTALVFMSYEGSFDEEVEIVWGNN